MGLFVPQIEPSILEQEKTTITNRKPWIIFIIKQGMGVRIVVYPLLG